MSIVGFSAPVQATFTTNTQISNDQAFLQGQYAEVGVRANGAFGSTSVPSGFNQNSGSCLGFRVDRAEDGWGTSGTTDDGDFFCPGSPFEGWQMKVGSNAYARNDHQGTNITGSNSNIQNSGSSQCVTWASTSSYNGVSVSQRYCVPTTEQALHTDVTLTNTTGSAIEDIFFGRGFDPDNTTGTGAMTCNGSTANTSTYQSCNAITGQGVEAQATARWGNGAFIALQSFDSRARVARQTSGFSSPDPSSIWTAGNTLATSGTYLGNVAEVFADAGIYVALKIPTLGASTSTSFRISYVLSAEGNKAPVVGSPIVSGISKTGATVSATVNPKGYSTSVDLVYSTSSSFSSSTTISLGTKTGDDEVVVQSGITGLSASTTYYAKIVATNEKGTTESSVATFNSLPTTAPDATSGTPTVGVGHVSGGPVTLSGTINPNGLASTATFEYGTTADFSGSFTSATLSDSFTGSSEIEISKSISGLTSSTQYYFRVKVTNLSGTAYGAIASFIPANIPVPLEGNTITFSYDPTTVTQNVQISTTDKTTLLATASATNVQGSPDLFFVGIELRGVGGGLIYSHNTGWVNLTNSYQDITLTVTASGVGAEAWALVDSVTLVLGGDDAEFWAGNYGPKVESASLKLDGTELMSNVEFVDGNRYWTSSVGWQACHGTQGNKPCASAGLYVTPTTTTTVPETTTTTSTTVYVPPATSTTVPYVPPVVETTVPAPSTATTTTIPEESTTTTLPEETSPETEEPSTTIPAEPVPVETTLPPVEEETTEPEEEEEVSPPTTLPQPTEVADVFDELPEDASAEEFAKIIEDIDFTEVTDEDLAEVLDSVFDELTEASEVTEVLETFIDADLTDEQLEAVLDKAFEDISDAEQVTEVLVSLLSKELDGKKLEAVMEAVFNENASVGEMGAVVTELLDAELSSEELVAVFDAVFDDDLSDSETIALAEEILKGELDAEEFGTVINAIFDEVVTDGVLIATFTAVLETELDAEKFAAIVGVLESEVISKEQVSEVVTLIIEQEGGIDSGQATELATSEKVLASIDGEQATKVFDAVVASEVSPEDGLAIVNAVQDAPLEVKEAFEEEINVFAGVFDEYVAIDSVINVGDRRTVIAVGAAVAVTGAIGAAGSPMGGSGGNSGGGSPQGSGNNTARRPEEEEMNGEIAWDGVEWIKQISIFRYNSGHKELDWGLAVKKFSYGLLNLGFTISGSLVVYLTLSGNIQTIAGISSVLALLGAMYLHMKEPE